MGLFDIFKKKPTVNIPNQEVRLPDQKSENSKEEAYEKSRSMLKSATSLKDIDIDKAISIIQEAIQICPENILADHFKLANYYHIANNKEKAYDTLQDLLDNLDPNDIVLYNMYRLGVHEKFCTLYYKEKEYKKYLQHYCLWFDNTNVAMACQGRKEDLQNSLDNRDKLGYLAPTKVNGSFKKLGKESSKRKFNDKLAEYFNNQKEALIEMANKAYDIGDLSNSDEFRVNESIGERSNRLLMKENQFMTAYKTFNSKQFNDFWETSLRQLIE